MKHLVCIRDNGFSSSVGTHPKKGDIVTFLKDGECAGFIVIKEHLFDNSGEEQCFRESCFRPVDDTLGEWVEETIMKEVAYEEAIA